VILVGFGRIVRSVTQVSANWGVFFDVNANPGADGGRLSLLESVRCLDCGAVYAKPSGGGTVRQNPGCPECGYVGWIDVGARVNEAWRPRRFVEGLPQRRSG
jgi:hypothetical protein